MFEAAGLGLGLIGAVGKLFARGAANRKLRQLQKEDPAYVQNPLAAQRLGLAKTLLNARAPGAAAAEQNIATNQANTISKAERGATDSSQLLSLTGDVQGTTNNAYGQLENNETQDYQRRFQNYTGAEENQINEDNKVFQDSVRRFGDKAQIQGAQSENNTNGWMDISNLGFGLADLSANGGFGNMFKKQQQKTPKFF